MWMFAESFTEEYEEPEALKKELNEEEWPEGEGKPLSSEEESDMPY